jgi:hypothetical protein
MDGPQLAKPVRAVRNGPVPAAFAVAPAVLQTYVGTFQTETVMLTVALGDGGRLIIGPPGQPLQPMRPTSENEFRVDSGGFRVVFHPETAP